MSYLDEAVTEITTPQDRAALLHVQETDTVSLSGTWDAKEYALRFYAKDRSYDGPTHTVAEEVDDGFQVMVMEEGQ